MVGIWLQFNLVLIYRLADEQVEWYWKDDMKQAFVD